MTDREEYILYKKLKDEGKTTREIASVTNSTLNHVRYCLKGFYQDILDRKDAKNMKDDEFEKLVLKLLPECNSLNHLCNRLGLRSVDGYYRKIKNIIVKNNADTSHFGTIKARKGDTVNEISDEDFFVEGVKREGKSLLRRLIRHSYKEYKCENPECGLSEWYGKPIPLEVHHINGNHYDNRIENLQLLCRNCHSQTDSFCRKKNRHNIKNNISKDSIESKEKEIKVPIREIKEEYNYCPCGKKIRKNLKYCSHECSNKYRRKNITKDDIFQAVTKTKSILGAAKILSLSDNGLRKICKRLNILEEVRKICGM